MVFSKFGLRGHHADITSQVEQGIELQPIEPSDQILKDIRDNRYDCGICMEHLRSDDITSYRLWHCSTCYHVYHFVCVKQIPTTPVTCVWKCPSCRTIHSELRGAQCWCGVRVESCIGTCLRRAPCKHGEIRTCHKACHPGPCSPPCTERCGNRPEHVPHITRAPSSWQRFRERFSTDGKEHAMDAIPAMLSLAITYAAMGVWLSWNIKWLTQPYNYPKFLEDWWGYTTIATILGVICFIPISAALWVFLLSAIADFSNASFNLQSRSSRPRLKCFVTSFGAFLSLLIFFAAVAFPLFAFPFGPQIVWYDQMKDSCKRLDTRIDLDSNFSTYMGHFHTHSLNPAGGPRDFYLASRTDPSPSLTTNAYQQFYRVTASTLKTPYIAIDIDLSNHIWRALSLSAPDTTNQYLANDYRHLTTRPFFPPINATLIQNGTFSPTSSKNPHLQIPELDIWIQNLYLFRTYNATQPFLRAYSTAGLNEEKIKALMGKEWSGINEDRVIMRTASFGHGRQRLDMCVREMAARVQEVDETGEVGFRHVSGVEERALVPLGIVLAFRDWARRAGGELVGKEV